MLISVKFPLSGNVVVLLWLVLSLALNSCKAKFEKLQTQIITSGADHRVDFSEFNTIDSLAIELKIESKGDSTRRPRLKKLIEGTLKRNSISIEEKDIVDKEVFTARFNISVYLENSASMNGYVGINSTFKTTVFKLLADLRNFSIVDDLRLNYINTKTIEIARNASSEDIDDFYKRLNPENFQKSGGSVASTDIEKMLKVMLDRMSPSDMNIFISDCVFSPGDKNAKKYLDGQYAAIYNDFMSARTAHPDLAVMILRCRSRFEGTYFDYLDRPHRGMDLERPYYIWFIGTEKQIQTLIGQGIDKLIKEGYDNKLVLQSQSGQLTPPFKIVLGGKVGQFRLDKKNPNAIINAEPLAAAGRQQFGFQVAVDYSASLQDARYFLETNNYSITHDFNVKEIKPSARENFTHELSVSTDGLKNGTMQVIVLGKVPDWVFAYTSMDDSSIDTSSDEGLRTFGLRYLIEGVTDAYYPKTKVNALASFSIPINKKD
jgi:hypothetical protein